MSKNKVKIDSVLSVVLVSLSVTVAAARLRDDDGRWTMEIVHVFSLEEELIAQDWVKEPLGPEWWNGYCHGLKT